MLRLTHTLLALALAAPSLLAHGGQYNAPGDSGSGTSAKGGAVAPSTNPEGANASSPGVAGARSDSRAGTGGRSTAGVRGVGRGGGRGASTSGGELAPAWDGWEFWWDANSARYLSLRGRLKAQGVSSGSIRRFTGKGRNLLDVGSVRPDDFMISDLIAPTLTALVGHDEADIADSSVLALARVSDPEQDPAVLDALLPQLSHRFLSVRSSTALSLGVLGDGRAEGALIELARDTSAGRQLVGGGQVDALVRCFATLALGMLHGDDGITCLSGMVRDLSPSDRDLLVAAAMGLSQVPSGHPRARAVLDVTRARLDDRYTDSLVKSHLVTVLAKVGGPDVVPELVAILEDRDSDPEVRQAVALALGRVGEVTHADAVRRLHQVIEAERDALSRHLAILALGRMGGRDPIPHEHVEVHADIEAMLRRELAGKGKQSAHRSWAGLAAALYLAEGHDADRRDRLTGRLIAAYDDESDPNHRGAFAVALGLAAARGAGPQLMRDLREEHDDVLRGHLATALGLLAERDAADDLMRLCTAANTSTRLRRQAAIGLGLMGERAAVTALVTVLDEAPTLGVSAGAAGALGLLGDSAAVDPLITRAADENTRPLTRGFSAAALGLLAERGELPFYASLLADAHYMARTVALAELMDLL